MRPPTRITPLSNIGRSLTILLECLTFFPFYKSPISSAYTSFCTSLTTAVVAFCRSSVLKYCCLYLSLDMTWILTARLPFASTNQEEYFTRNSCILLRTISTDCKVNIAFSTLTSKLVSGRSPISVVGHSASGWDKNAGPANHLSLLKSCWAESPRDASWAGFRFRGQCLHWLGSETCLISHTRFAT